MWLEWFGHRFHLNQTCGTFFGQSYLINLATIYQVDNRFIRISNISATLLLRMLSSCSVVIKSFEHLHFSALGVEISHLHVGKMNSAIHSRRGLVYDHNNPIYHMENKLKVYYT